MSLLSLIKPESVLDENRDNRENPFVARGERPQDVDEFDNLAPADVKTYLKLREVFDQETQGKVSLKRLAAA